MPAHAEDTPVNIPSRLLLVGLVDGRQAAIERNDVRLHLQQLHEVKDQLGDRFEAVVEAHTGSDSTRGKAVGGLLKTLLPTGLAAGVALGLGSLTGGLGLALLGAPVVWGGARQLKEWAELPRWQGRKTFHIGQGEVERGSQAPAARPLVERLGQAMRDYPGSRTVMLVGGHGLGYYTSAGMPMHELGQAMQTLQQPVDIALFDSCLMGNVEALAQLGDRARIAITAEGLMPTQRSQLGAMPLADMLKAAAQSGDLAGAARQMVEQAADSMLEQRGPDSEKVTTLRQELAQETDPDLKRINKTLLDIYAPPIPGLAAVDLQALQQGLLPALDRLGRQLTQQLQQGQLQPILAAARQSQLSDSKAFHDLGSFLQQLGSPEAQQAAEALQAALLAQRSEEGSGFSGLSIQLLPLEVAPEGTRVEGDPISQPHDLKGLPQGWVEFTHAFKRALARP